MSTSLTFRSSLLALAAFAAAAGVRGQAPTSGSLYYTTFSNPTALWSVQYNYNGTSLSLSNNHDIAATQGADGLVFTHDGDVAVAGQTNDLVSKVNPTTGTILGTVPSGPAGDTQETFHLMVAPNGDIFSAGDYFGQSNNVPTEYDGDLTNPGTLFSVSGDDSTLITLAWAGSDPTHAFYTTSTPTGDGDFGTAVIDYTNHTITTTQIASDVPAAHGMAYDPFSGDLILMGATDISQYTTSGSLVATLDLGGEFDQGTVDGQGHIFAANNTTGNITFIDYSNSKNISTAYYLVNTSLNTNLDDVAPLVGQGSQHVPDGLGLWPAAAAIAALLAAARLTPGRRGSISRT